MDTCLYCGKPKPPKNKKFCSMACASAYRQHHRTCVVCGKTFACSPANNNVCCSPQCAKVHRELLRRDGIYDDAVSKWIDGKKRFFDEHSGPDHINAKHWVIQSPSGQIYECQNLMHFIRTHPDLFDGTSKQVYDGFVKIKASYQGKRHTKSYTYKGWKLLNWD